MTDKFDVNRYKAENDLLTLTEEQKRLITVQMRQAEKTMKTENTKSRKPFWLKTVAAALAVAVIGTSTYLIADTVAPKKNGFVITVNAAATTDQNNDSSITAGYSDTAMSGAFMDYPDDSPYLKDGYHDYFSEYFVIEDLNFIGTNVKSVSLKSEKKGVYFHLLPMTLGKDYIQEKALRNFSDYDSLDNSQYTFEEFKNYADKENYYGVVCDGFTYDNSENVDGTEQVILKNEFKTSCFKIILESDHSDEEIAEWVKEIDALKRSDTRYKELEKKIQKKTLDGAKISVTVTYTDDSTETKTINLKYNGNKKIAFEIES
ncbi:MAG: hypothetical protein J1E96_07310 [Ruminococcus sp.]|nr:hypothetical protein [Ruminococcus sp.]